MTSRPLKIAHIPALTVMAIAIWPMLTVQD
jgi:hypothetical protein